MDADLKRGFDRLTEMVASGHAREAENIGGRDTVQLVERALPTLGPAGVFVQQSVFPELSGANRAVVQELLFGGTRWMNEGEVTGSGFSVR